MDRQAFERFRELIHRESGIALSEEKVSLLSSRIQKRLQALKLKNELEYLEVIETDLSGEELIQLIDNISTNVTYFYREPYHFEVLAGELEKFKSEKRKQVKIWCAASSSGEEPYTICLEATQHLDLKVTNFKLLATDICTRVLNEACAAVYSEKELEKVPAHLRLKYFESLPSGNDEQESKWQVGSALRKMAFFKKLNLAKFPYPLQGPIDIIFCRNVMIYFDRELRGKIVNEFYRLLPPGGLLFLSLSESLLGIEHKFEKYDTSVFRKN